MRRLRFLAILAVFPVTACETSPPEAERVSVATPIATEDGFRTRLADRTLRDDRKFEMSYNGDGSVTGDMHGVAVTGSWTWEGERLCRTLTVGLSRYGRQCLSVSADTASARFDGTGADPDVRWSIL